MPSTPEYSKKRKPYVPRDVGNQELIMGFSSNFLWGAAASSGQIEGGFADGGRTPSIWDFSPEGKIANNENCRIACDHYHRMREDIALMKEIGLKSYRFSVSWSRIFPEKGVINPEGIKFYSDLIDELIKAGIEPMITIYHWDLPLWVENEGGWLSGKIVSLFTEYTRVLVDEFSDRVKWWMTINEPVCFIKCGYVSGIFAPYKKKPHMLSRLTRNCMLAHGMAIKTIRERARQRVMVGAAFSTGAYIPLDDSPETVEKARDLTFNKGEGLAVNRWWMDPILLGRPVRMGIHSSKKKDMKIIHQPLDFLGLNIYQPFEYVNPDGSINKGTKHLKRNTMDWICDGRCLYWDVKFLYERYSIPIMITENGYSGNDTVGADGRVLDPEREAFMTDFISALKRVNDEGVPILGYQHWSVIDNFEWTAGYAPRFGLIHVDYETQKRTIKESARFYSEIIRTNGENL